MILQVQAIETTSKEKHKELSFLVTKTPCFDSSKLTSFFWLQERIKLLKIKEDSLFGFFNFLWERDLISQNSDAAPPLMDYVQVWISEVTNIGIKYWLRVLEIHFSFKKIFNISK